jgi:hypothetical protein
MDAPAVLGRRRPEEPQVVLVERDDAWHRGLLFEWLQLDDGRGWRALVRYSVAPGYQYDHWVPASRVRRPE